jgi:hypothetical protein
MTRSQIRDGSRSPFLAKTIISFATATAAGSLRSTSPSLLNAASNAVVKVSTSSGSNTPPWSVSKILRIGTCRGPSVRECSESQHYIPESAGRPVRRIVMINAVVPVPGKSFEEAFDFKEVFATWIARMLARIGHFSASRGRTRGEVTVPSHC